MTQQLQKSRLLVSAQCAPEQMQPDFETQFEEFKAIVHSVLYSESENLAIAQSLDEALCLLEESLPSKKKERSLSPYLRRAKRLLNLCIRQNDLRLTNPELFTPLQPVARSPLKWTGKKAELYELLIALDNLDIITENGVKASFSSIVREFSRTAGLPYDTDCHNERRRILARNTRRTVFIDRLKKEGFKNDEIFSD